MGFAHAVGVGLPEQSEPEGPQGAARGPPNVAPVDASCGGAARAEKDNANAKISIPCPPPIEIANLPQFG